MSALVSDAASFPPDRLAVALEAARASGHAEPVSAFEIPVDAASAYRTQAARWVSRSVPGWKVALDESGQSVFAPLDPVWRSDSETCPWRPKLGLEVELAFVLARDLPARPGRAYDRDEIEASIGSVNLGVEIVESRLAEGGTAPFPLFLADALANGGYILGPVILDDWREGGWLSATVSDTVLFEGPAKHPQTDPMLPLIARINRRTAGWGDLLAGQIVTTGSLCGVLDLNEPGDVAITLGSTTMTARFRA